MKTGTVLALVGVGLAAIDITGFARYVEIGVRKAMGPLREWGTSMADQNTRFQRALMYAVLAVLLIFVASAVVEWMLGASIVPRFTKPDGTVENLLAWLTNILTMAVACISGLGALALGLWWVLWALARPRKGVVSAVGFLLAVGSLVYELVN